MLLFGSATKIINAGCWIAMEFDGIFDFSRVEIFNRLGCCGDRMENLRITAADTLPANSSSFMGGGNLFASFTGPGTTGQSYIFTGSAKGSVLVCQMETNGNAINLAEIKPLTDSFFDNVVVNDDNNDIKNNRLELLKMFCNTFNNFVNFSKLEGI